MSDRFLKLRSENSSLRISSGKRIYELLNGGVGIFISGLEFAGGVWSCVGWRWKRVNRRATRIPFSVSR
jgi:hypothetical protein